MLGEKKQILQCAFDRRTKSSPFSRLESLMDEFQKSKTQRLNAALLSQTDQPQTFCPGLHNDALRADRKGDAAFASFVFFHSCIPSELAAWVRLKVCCLLSLGKTSCCRGAPSDAAFL